jgi:hypothetical protein
LETYILGWKSRTVLLRRMRGYGQDKSGKMSKEHYPVKTVKLTKPAAMGIIYQTLKEYDETLSPMAEICREIAEELGFK